MVFTRIARCKKASECEKQYVTVKRKASFAKRFLDFDQIDNVFQVFRLFLPLGLSVNVAELDSSSLPQTKYWGNSPGLKT